MRYLVLALLLTGCVTSRRVMTPDGESGWYIECPRDYGRCIMEAAEKCPNGYEILSSDSVRGAVATTNMVGTTAVTHAYPTYRGMMTIECRDRRKLADE